MPCARVCCVAAEDEIDTKPQHLLKIILRFNTIYPFLACSDYVAAPVYTFLLLFRSCIYLDLISEHRDPSASAIRYYERKFSGFELLVNPSHSEFFPHCLKAFTNINRKPGILSVGIHPETIALRNERQYTCLKPILALSAAYASSSSADDDEAKHAPA